MPCHYVCPSVYRKWGCCCCLESRALRLSVALPLLLRGAQPGANALPRKPPYKIERDVNTDSSKLLPEPSWDDDESLSECFHIPKSCVLQWGWWLPYLEHSRPLMLGHRSLGFSSRNLNVKCGAEMHLLKVYLVPFYFYIINCGNEIYDEICDRKLHNNVQGTTGEKPAFRMSTMDSVT